MAKEKMMIMDKFIDKNYLLHIGTVSREQMEIIVKAQPKSTKEMVKSSIMCNLKMPSPTEEQQKTIVDPLLEQDDKALFYINYSSLVENPIKHEKNIHTAINQAARNQNLQMKYGTNATGVYTIFHKKHFIIGGVKGKPN